MTILNLLQTEVMALLILLVVFRRPYAGEELYKVTDVVAYLALLTMLVVKGDDYDDSHTDFVNYFRRPYAGEKLYSVMNVIALKHNHTECQAEHQAVRQVARSHWNAF